MSVFHSVLVRMPPLGGLALAASALLLAVVPAKADQGWRFFGAAAQPGYNAPAAAGYAYTSPGPSYSGRASSYAPAYGAASYTYGAPAFGPYYRYGSFSPGQTAAYYGPAAEAERPAVIDVRVPAGAVILFDGHRTAQTGPERRFLSPPLRPGHVYAYEVQVRWQDGDRQVERRRQVEVRAGRQTNLDFTRAGSSDGTATSPNTGD
jgi:uncharacterized protein (TIGR03000 family)